MTLCYMYYVICIVPQLLLVMFASTKFKSCRVENIFGILAFNWVKPDYARPDQLE